MTEEQLAVIASVVSRAPDWIRRDLSSTDPALSKGQRKRSPLYSRQQSEALPKRGKRRRVLRAGGGRRIELNERRELGSDQRRLSDCFWVSRPEEGCRKRPISAIPQLMFGR